MIFRPCAKAALLSVVYQTETSAGTLPKRQGDADHGGQYE
jgi:hypothetical protein